MNHLYRSETDRIIGGVCGGLGEYLHVNPLLVRILFVLLAMTSGLGFLPVAAYILLWIFVPTRRTETLSHDELLRQNVDEIGQRAREFGHEAQNALRGNRWGESADSIASNRMIVLGGGLVLVGLLLLLDSLGLLWWFRWGTLWPLLIIALGAVILLNNLKDKH
jgi:phage shock protein C